MADNLITLSSSSSPNEQQSNGQGANGRSGMERDVYLASESGKVNKLRWLNWKHQKTPTGNNVLHVHVGRPIEYVKDDLQFIQFVLDETRDSCLLLETNDKGDTPLHLAVRFGHTDAVKEFLKYVEVVELLNKANKNLDTALHDAARVGHATIIKLLFEQTSGHGLELDHMPNKFGETPLFLAAERSYTESFRAIVGHTGLTALEHRGPFGQTALHDAVKCGNTDIVAQILEIDTKGSLIKIKNDKGRTPLHCCVARNDKKQRGILKALLNHDDHYNSAVYIQDNEGRTALHIATLNFNFKGVKKLIRSYPDCTEIVDNKGQNVVHLAASSGRLHAFEWFLTKAPNCDKIINEKDNEGNTPLHLLAASTPTILIRDWRYTLPKFVKRHYELDVKAFNDKNLTAGDIIASNEGFHHVTRYMKLSKTLPRGRRANNSDERTEVADSVGTIDNIARTEIRVKSTKQIVTNLRKVGETRLVVAALIVTVSFTAGLTVPGGFDQTPGGKNIGLAVLREKDQFTTFLIADTIAFIMSSLAVMCHFTIAGEKDLETVTRLSMAAEILSSISLFALMLAFQAAVSLVVSPNPSFPIFSIYSIFVCCYSVLFNHSYRSVWKYWTREARKHGV